jgi:hypothetical protein
MRAASAGVRLARLAQPWHTFHVASQTARTQPRSIRACCGQCLGLRRLLSCFACIAIIVAPQSTPMSPKVHVGSGRQAALVARTGRARSAATGLATAVGMCCVLTLRGWTYAGQTGDNLDGVAARVYDCPNPNPELLPPRGPGWRRSCTAWRRGRASWCICARPRCPASTWRARPPRWPAPSWCCRRRHAQTTTARASPAPTLRGWPQPAAPRMGAPGRRQRRGRRRGAPAAAGIPSAQRSAAVSSRVRRGHPRKASTGAWRASCPPRVRGMPLPLRLRRAARYAVTGGRSANADSGRSSSDRQRWPG